MTKIRLQKNNPCSISSIKEHISNNGYEIDKSFFDPRKRCFVLTLKEQSFKPMPKPSTIISRTRKLGGKIETVYVGFFLDECGLRLSFRKKGSYEEMKKYLRERNVKFSINMCPEYIRVKDSLGRNCYKKFYVINLF